MNRPRRNRHRAGGLLLAVVGLLAAVGALAGLAVAKSDHSQRSEKRHHGHHHRHHSGEKSGTIASFDADTGKLTISLLNGDTVSGLVTRGTKIRCKDEHAPDVTQLRHGGESEPSDDHGGHGEAEPGDDHGGGDNSGPGSSHSGGGPSGHDDNGSGANCTTSDLIVGAAVVEAELEIEHSGAFWDEVELAD